MKTRTTSAPRPAAPASSASRRCAAVGALAASAAFAGRVSAASVLPPEFRARIVEPLPAAWLRDDRDTGSHLAMGPAVVHADDQLPAVTRFDIPPGPLSAV